MSETVNIPQCWGCGEELAGRSDARYCSGACRQKAYRDRKRILDRYGSWENVLAELTANPPWSVTDTGADSRNEVP